MPGKLAFVAQNGKQQEIYTSDLFFRNVRRLTRDGSYSQHPRWSPDGRKLLYTGYYRTGFPDIFLIDLDTGRRVTIAQYKGLNTGATFSPNGQAMAMVPLLDRFARSLRGRPRGPAPATRDAGHLP